MGTDWDRKRTDRRQAQEGRGQVVDRPGTGQGQVVDRPGTGRGQARDRRGTGGGQVENRPETGRGQAGDRPGTGRRQAGDRWGTGQRQAGDSCGHSAEGGAPVAIGTHSCTPCLGPAPPVSHNTRSAGISYNHLNSQLCREQAWASWDNPLSLRHARLAQSCCPPPQGTDQPCLRRW